MPISIAMRWLRATRADEWWWYKIPPLLAVAYALILSSTAETPAIGSLIFSVVALMGVAAFAYVVNDASDVREDEARGKFNAMATWKVWQRCALAGALLGGALVAASTASTAPAARVVFGAECALPLLYSVRPVRLKERGAFGIVADALMVHIVPTIWLGMVLATPGNTSSRSAIVLGSAVCWSAGLGFRGILLHQLTTRGAVARAGTRTFAVGVSARRLQQLILHRILPVEAIALGVFVLALVPVAPLLIPTLVLFLVTEHLRRRAGWRIPWTQSEAGDTHPYVPLVFNEAHEVWLPLILAVQIAVVHPPLVTLVAVHAALFAPSLLQCGREYGRLAMHMWRRRDHVAD